MKNSGLLPPRGADHFYAQSLQLFHHFTNVLIKFGHHSRINSFRISLWLIALPFHWAETGCGVSPNFFL